MLKRFIVEDSGMEMVEWAIVGVLFAVAGAGFFTTLNGNLQTGLAKIGAKIQ